MPRQHVNKESVSRVIVWLRNDLRITDNRIMSAASAFCGVPTIFLFCFDPRHYSAEARTTLLGAPRCGAPRAKFLRESVLDLRQNLRSLGSDLLASLDTPENTISGLATPNSVVVVQSEPAYDEHQTVQNVRRIVLQKGGELREIEFGGVLFLRSELPFEDNLSNLPNVFTKFRTAVEQHCTIVKPSPAPEAGAFGPVILERDLFAQEPPVLCGYKVVPTEKDMGFDTGAFNEVSQRQQALGVMTFTGGETAGTERLRRWMFDHDHLKNYFNTRNGMLGEASSSKLSPWLANGCLSVRVVAAECRRYETTRGIKNKSTRWLVFELLWREFFRLLVEKFGARTFSARGMRGNERNWSQDSEMLHQWMEGHTGVPLVDASMRELATTGWMSNRARQNVASYFVHNLGMDWRLGAEYFESLLLDSDVYLNYGNWNAAAGLTGGRVNVFNQLKQSKAYDPEGAYIKHWCPELAKLPVPLCFEPWKVPHARLTEFGIAVGSQRFRVPTTDPGPSHKTPKRRTRRHLVQNAKSHKFDIGSTQHRRDINQSNTKGPTKYKTKPKKNKKHTGSKRLQSEWALTMHGSVMSSLCNKN